MADNIIKNRGRTAGYKLDRGGMPTESGPFIGIVKNNSDPNRTGRIQVYIEEFSKLSKDDPTGWRTVSYMTPYYGKVEHNGTSEGTGTFVGNTQSYGMWFTAPDIGTRVMCFFVNGDPSYGYYTGCVPESGLTHMVPAIGGNVTEINVKNKELTEDPRYYDSDKPEHKSIVATMYQQGLQDDTIRGPITSSSQRESPSTVFGISTPGRPVYANGMYDADAKQTLEDNITNETADPEDVKIIGRRGGHSIVMDDGDLEGNNQLMRLRTSLGHQITMSDDGETFYITHANGQSWIELGKAGNIDVFSTNSVNVRTQGTINLHADEDVNINAGNNVNIKANNTFNTESTGNTNIGAKQIDLNKSGASTTTTSINSYKDVEITDDGWTATEDNDLSSICTVVPTHEPYANHGIGDTGITPIDRDTLDEQIVTLIDNKKVEPPKYT